MKSFPTQPRLHYFVLSSLILVSLRGVTSQDVISINYTGPAVVSVGTQITFTGTITSAIPGALPTSFSFYGKKTGDSTIFQICSVDYGDCGASPTPPCYCTGQNNDTYNFTMEDTATLERSEVFIRGSIGGSDLARYPEIRAQTTAQPPTTANTTCIVEEGNSYSLKCPIDDYTASFSWETTQNDSIVRSIQVCFLTDHRCQPGPDGTSGYSSTISSDNKTSILTIESVSRRSTQNDGMPWHCTLTVNGKFKPQRICHPLDIYAKPEKPTCSLQKLQPGDTQLSMTCVTNKVFPEAKCQLYNNHETHPLALTEASIKCSHQRQNSDPDYFNSTCTVNISVTRLGVGQHQLFVKMFPDVTDGSHIADIDSNIVPVDISYPQVEVSSSCFNGTNVKGKYIKTGTISSCTCTMTNTGNPPGQVQWYIQGNSTPIGSLVSNGSVIFNIKEENTYATQVYYCEVTSVLIESNRTDSFTRQFAYGPDSVNFTGQNQYNQCLGEGQSITVVCSVPKAAVNPKSNFRIVSKNEKIAGNGTEQDEGDYFSYTYSFKPNGGGIYNLTCEAENSKFSDLIKTASHNVIVQAPPKDAPVIKIINQEKEEIEISGSIVKIIEGEPVTVKCHVDGGYPPAIVTLNCSSLNESSVAETVVSLTSVRFTREMDNQTCICTATHVSGCYQHSQTSVWLNVSLSSEPVSDENTDLDAAAVGGGIGAAVIVIVLIILVICVLKRKGIKFPEKAIHLMMDMKFLSCQHLRPQREDIHTREKSLLTTSTLSLQVSLLTVHLPLKEKMPRIMLIPGLKMTDMKFLSLPTNHH